MAALVIPDRGAEGPWAGVALEVAGVEVAEAAGVVVEEVVVAEGVEEEEGGGEVGNDNDGYKDLHVIIQNCFVHTDSIVLPFSIFTFLGSSFKGDMGETSMSYLCRFSLLSYTR